MRIKTGTMGAKASWHIHYATPCSYHFWADGSVAEPTEFLIIFESKSSADAALYTNFIMNIMVALHVWFTSLTNVRFGGAGPAVSQCLWAGRIAEEVRSGTQLPDRIYSSRCPLSSNTSGCPLQTTTINDAYCKRHKHSHSTCGNIRASYTTCTPHHCVTVCWHSLSQPAVLHATQKEAADNKKELIRTQGL